ncbi:hypothetical protein T265_03038 [Opisthorchis viverrini]|uniref:Uncharacterized protein n=1 Tax=Opisthorchis viverrini TaxID=6198 RepID=A0A075AHV8_OPIVI|nr:hypothetical protein T265_03038 [Opisthorchis viverrini]KER30559.1 hypothetical protein T265_03038 [Opisthorchis viverrini]
MYSNDSFILLSPNSSRVQNRIPPGQCFTGLPIRIVPHRKETRFAADVVTGTPYIQNPVVKFKSVEKNVVLRLGYNQPHNIDKRQSGLEVRRHKFLPKYKFAPVRWQQQYMQLPAAQSEELPANI